MPWKGHGQGIFFHPWLKENLSLRRGVWTEDTGWRFMKEHVSEFPHVVSNWREGELREVGVLSEIGGPAHHGEGTLSWRE